MSPPLARRRLLALGAGCGATLALPAAAQSLATLPEMTEGPFYPSRRWRAQRSDWDADLTRVRQGVQELVAQGEHLGLALQVQDSSGRAVDRVEFEIWQCDTRAVYRHPAQAGLDERLDPGFQGFGAAFTDVQGWVRFRTIRPVPYPGRTPHIHVKLRHPAFGELTSQLFVAGDPGNARDGLWRRLPADARAALDMTLQPASDEGLRWRVQHLLRVPA